MSTFEPWTTNLHSLLYCTIYRELFGGHCCDLLFFRWSFIFVSTTIGPTVSSRCTGIVSNTVDLGMDSNPIAIDRHSINLYIMLFRSVFWSYFKLLFTCVDHCAIAGLASSKMNRSWKYFYWNYVEGLAVRSANDNQYKSTSITRKYWCITYDRIRTGVRSI